MSRSTLDYVYLFEDDSVSVELVCGGGCVLYLGWDSEAKGSQLSHLPQ